jgi:GntR family transcriptional regulator of vanillate catabolism
MAKEEQGLIRILRHMILSGEFPAGERIAEIPTAKRLGVSRTPIRIAFRMLEQEGLLTKLGNRGYQVRAIDEEEIKGAIEVRGVLEGLAALHAAERGLSNDQKSRIQECLDQGDRLFNKGHITEKDMEIYQDINQRFHNEIISAAANPAINAALSRNEHLPFASSNAIAFDPDKLDREFKRLNFAHMQHHAVFDAISNRQGARAEAIMREHANATINYAKIFSDASISRDKIRVVGFPTAIK